MLWANCHGFMSGHPKLGLCNSISSSYFQFPSSQKTWKNIARSGLPRGGVDSSGTATLSFVARALAKVRVAWTKTSQQPWIQHRFGIRKPHRERRTKDFWDQRLLYYDSQEPKVCWTKNSQWRDTESLFPNNSAECIECRLVDLPWFLPMALALGNVISWKIETTRSMAPPIQNWNINWTYLDKGSFVFMHFTWCYKVLASAERIQQIRRGHLFLRRPGWKESARSRCKPQEIQAKRDEAQLQLWSKATECKRYKVFNLFQCTSIHSTFHCFNSGQVLILSWQFESIVYYSVWFQLAAM